MQIALLWALLVECQIHVIKLNNVNVNNGGVITTGKQVPTTGTLLIKKICGSPGGRFCGNSYDIGISGGGRQPQNIRLRDNGENQTVTLSPGPFDIQEIGGPLFPTYSGDCMQIDPMSATGTISGGQHLTCIINNNRF
jgi:hypothetical protein